MSSRFTIYPPGHYDAVARKPARKRRAAALARAAQIPSLSYDAVEDRWTTDDEGAVAVMESLGVDLVVDRMLPGYERDIWKATNCAIEDAAVIEEVMRVERPILSELDRRQFNHEARVAQATLAWMRKNDPDCAAFYEGSAAR